MNENIKELFKNFPPPDPNWKHPYDVLRRLEYPSIEEQLDAIWKGGKAAKEMAAQIQAVKDKYPKP